MTVIGTTTHDPDDVTDRRFDWGTWLAARGSDTIDSATVIVGTGLTKDSQSNTTTTVDVWLSGGTVNDVVDVTCRITTTAGRTKDATLAVKVQEE